MLPILGIGLGLQFAGQIGQSLFGGMNSCCDGIMGGQNCGGRDGTLAGGLTGALFGGAFGGLGGALFGGVGGALLGNILGKHHHHRHHHMHQGECFPPPCGGGFGGPGNGCYGPPNYGGGFDGGYGGGYGGYGGGANQAAQMQMLMAQQQQLQTMQMQQQYGGGGAYQQGFQNGYQQGQYQQGFQDGFGAAQQQFGGYGRPQGYDYNGGCCPPQRCCPPWQQGGSTGNPGGQLCQEGPGKPINYHTSGGWNVSVNGDKVIITDPSGQHKIEHSGDPHEYLDGKHIKDWEGKDRSILLPDGTKISMGATGAQGLITGVSIYDGDQNVQINNQQNQVTHRSFNPYDTKAREFYQADGETSRVSEGWRGLSYQNLYTQDQNLGVRPNFKDLGFAKNEKWYQEPFFGLFSGPRVNDRYDDPRLLFT